MSGYGHTTVKRMMLRTGTAHLGRSKQSLEQIIQAWFPANPTVLKNIQTKLHEGKYKANRRELIEDIKHDPAIFIYCARNMRRVADNVPEGFDPFEMLVSINDAQLLELLNVPASKISSHNFADINKNQASRLQYSLVGAHAAELIAQQVDLSSDLAFASAVFRQLGLNLIAWNYPRIYSKAITIERERPGHLDLELEKLLEISPAHLGEKLAAEWGVHMRIRKSIAPAHSGERAETESTDSGPINLQAVCELSELYAQKKDPVNYPHAEQQWEAMAPFVESVVDTQALDEAAEKVHRILGENCGSVEAIASLPLVEHHGNEDIAALRRTEQLFLANMYVQKCPEQVRERFQQVYSQLAHTRMSVEALQLLVDNVLPVLGFARGCLFLANDRSLELRPAMAIGDAALEEYETFLDTRDNGIAIALESMVPVRKDGIGVKGSKVTQVSCSLQSAKHPGVLYLELSEEVAAGTTHQTVPYFHAVRATINDCIAEGR